jgi:hypothetical protein
LFVRIGALRSVLRQAAVAVMQETWKGAAMVVRLL